MPSNLYVLPAYGKAITLDDQGLFYVLNSNTGAIQTVIQLAYQDDDWYMFQLQKTSVADEYCWTVLADSSGYALNSLTSEQIMHHFSKPQFAEPKGAWQGLRNGKYGFGKFTPVDAQDDTGYAILMFSEHGMHAVIRLHKAEENFMQDTVETITYQQVEFA